MEKRIGKGWKGRDGEKGEKRKVNEGRQRAGGTKSGTGNGKVRRKGENE